MNRSDPLAALARPFPVIEPGAAPLQSAPASPTDLPSILGVVRSLSGRNWMMARVDQRSAAAMAQQLGLPEIFARVLAARGVDLDGAAAFLDPRLRDLLPDPLRLKDMRSGAERLAAAVVGGEKIAVFGDYDVDGATAAALLLRFLRAVGSEPLLYVPDRLREGYGPNAAALRGLRDRGVALVVTVDCGIAAHAALADAATVGLDVVVVDHHQASLPLPCAVAIVNPKRPDDVSGLDHLCAAGLAFLLAVDTNRLLRAAGHYQARPEPDLRQWLDLVALGTVCDVVPLTGVNRAFVTQGLKVMAQRRNVGLRALGDLAGLRGPVTARDLGFAIGPRINAGGRVGQADLGARLLASDDSAEAGALAARLNALNRERQAIEQAVLAQAIAGIGADGDGGPLLWAAGQAWHPGVVGIVASRLAERYRRPALVLAIDGDRAVASGRSVPGRDLGAAVNAAVAAGLLIKGGGHAMAAGFTAETGRLPELRAFLEARLALDPATAEGLRALMVDGMLSLAGAAALAPALLARLAPFGAGHAEPRFALEAVRIAHIRPAGIGHLVCGLSEGGARLPAIAFRCADQPLGQALAAHAGAPFHFVGRLQPRRGGDTLQLVIDDAAPALGG